MYSDCYLREDVDEVNEILSRLTQVCVKAIQAGQLAQLSNSKDYAVAINNELENLKLYHNKKLKRDEHINLTKGVWK